MGKYLGNCVVLRGRTNALKFHGGRPPHIHIGAERNDHKWTFSVKDNGIGIEKQYGELVFQMFQRLHERGRYDGSGIGLAIAKKIVERHDGRIWFDSELRAYRAIVGTLEDFWLGAASLPQRDGHSIATRIGYEH